MEMSSEVSYTIESRNNGVYENWRRVGNVTLLAVVSFKCASGEPEKTADCSFKDKKSLFVCKYMRFES